MCRAIFILFVTLGLTSATIIKADDASNAFWVNIIGADLTFSHKFDPITGATQVYPKTLKLILSSSKETQVSILVDTYTGYFFHDGVFHDYEKEDYPLQSFFQASVSNSDCVGQFACSQHIDISVGRTTVEFELPPSKPLQGNIQFYLMLLDAEGNIRRANRRLGVVWKQGNKLPPKVIPTFGNAPGITVDQDPFVVGLDNVLRQLSKGEVNKRN